MPDGEWREVTFAIYTKANVGDIYSALHHLALEEYWVDDIFIGAATIAEDLAFTTNAPLPAPPGVNPRPITEGSAKLPPIRDK